VDRWRGLAAWISPFDPSGGPLRIEFLAPTMPPPYQPKPGDRVRPRGGGPGSFEGTVLSVLPDGRFLVAGDDLDHRWTPPAAADLEPAPERVCAEFNRPFSDRHGVVESIWIDINGVSLRVRPSWSEHAMPADLEDVMAVGPDRHWVKITLPGEAKP
jgi:hypothetical protein